jgi:hypothetical protein
VSRKLPRWIPGLLSALAVFLAATLGIHAELWRRGASSVVPLSHPPEAPSNPGHARVGRADVTFEAWLVSRNARTLATRPHRLFDTEHCAPAEKTLTLGIPMITMGALAIPAFFASGDPILTYNLTLVVLPWLAALATYLLVVAWTGVPAAGIAAGLLYGFHATRLADIAHPSVWDTAWTPFALLFAQRLFSHGRWRDAVGLAASIALQIGASFYALLAAAFLTSPYAIWLIHRQRLRHASPAQVAFVVVATALAVAALLGPYLLAPAEADMHRSRVAFAPLKAYLPGAQLFPGWTLLALAAASLLQAPRPSERRAGDPRWPLLAGVLLVALVAAGPSHRALLEPVLPDGASAFVPDLYRAFAAVLPGLDAVRVVRRLCQGVYVGLAILAGFGAAALIRRSGRLAAASAVGIVLVAAFDVVRAPSLGFERTYRWGYAEIRPSDEDVEFFAELERRGSAGPILELPVDQGWSVVDGPPRILLAAYHQRRTSACYGSYFPAGRRELAQLAARLPDPDAIASLSRLGFTTVLLHGAGGHPRGLRQLRRMERAAREHAGVARIHTAGTKAAYRLDVETAARP